MATLFESEACSRCGGSGHYSYCQMYGTTCFKCAGRKIVLTKRGAEAQRYFTERCSKRAADLKPGDKVYYDGLFGKAGWSEVIEVRAGDAARDGGSVLPDGTVKAAELIVETKLCKHHTSADAMFRVAQSKEDRAAKVAEALAYQETLTKSGKPKASKKPE